MEITKEYARAYVEVLEIIKLLPKDLYEKIPKERIGIYEQYKEKEYEFKIDSTKNIELQISDTAKNVISNLFVKFLINDNDKKEFFEEERKRFWQEEVDKKENIKINPIFESNSTESKNIKEEIVSSELIIKEEKNFLKKILDKIKNFFVINKGE